MTPEQMRAQSASKVKQITELMKVLHIRVEARQRMSPEGFIENIVFWIDDEKYKAAEPAAKEPETEITSDHA